jgi:hypothetical protein
VWFARARRFRRRQAINSTLAWRAKHDVAHALDANISGAPSIRTRLPAGTGGTCAPPPPHCHVRLHPT